MKAIVITEPGPPTSLQPTEVPDPIPGPTDLLIKVHTTALNRGDLLQRRGLYPQPGPAPEHEIPGLEYAGEVESVGAEVTTFKTGDRVMGILIGGGYAEKVVVHERMAIAIPHNLSFAEAATIPEAYITAHDALSQASFRPGESLLVHAAGSGVGVAVIQCGKLLGASAIFGTAGSDAKLNRAVLLGLDHPISYKAKDFAEEIANITKGRGVDVIIDFVGASYLDRNLRSIAECGRIVVVGMLGGIRGELELSTLLTKRVVLRGTVLRPRPLEEKITATQAFASEILPHLAAGKIQPVIDRTFKLDEIAEAHRYMETNANFGKIVVEVV